MKSLLLAGCALLLCAGSSAAPASSPASLQEESDYPQRLALALLSEAPLPAAPSASQALHDEAQDLLAGRPPETPVKEHEERVRAFCASLPLSEAQRGQLLERLLGLERAKLNQRTAKHTEPRLDGRKEKVMSDQALELSRALGRTSFEAFAGPAADVPTVPTKVMGPIMSKPGLRISAPPPGRKADAAIPLRELETWVQFGSPPSLWDRARTALGYPPAPDPGVELSKRAIMRMQTTPEGREVLRELEREYAKSGKKVVIRPADIPGSAVVRSQGIEGIDGTRGRAYTTAGIYEFNRKFLEFKDKDVAMEYLCGNMAHELRHIVSNAQVRRLSPSAVPAFDRALLDEQRARLTGYLVAARLSSGKATDYSQEATSLARRPERYWDSLKRQDSYIDGLDADEMADPVKAYTERLAVIQSRIDALKKDIAELPKTGAQLRILEDKEGLKAVLSELRSEYNGWLVSQPDRLKGYQEQLAELTALRDKLKSPRGKALLKGFQAAAQDPTIRRLAQDLARDQRALAELVAKKPLPKPKPDAKQLEWDDFEARVQQSFKDHPGFWTGYKARYGAP